MRPFNGRSISVNIGIVNPGRDRGTVRRTGPGTVRVERTRWLGGGASAADRRPAGFTWEAFLLWESTTTY